MSGLVRFWPEQINAVIDSVPEPWQPNCMITIIYLVQVMYSVLNVERERVVDQLQQGRCLRRRHPASASSDSLHSLHLAHCLVSHYTRSKKVGTLTMSSLASCLIYARALLEYVIIIMWLLLLSRCYGP